MKKEKNKTMTKRKTFTRKLLRSLINESIRELIQEEKQFLKEQTAAQCQQIYALTDPNTNLNFPACCEMYDNWDSWTPNQPNDPCKTIRAQAMAIHPNFDNCCDPNFGTGGDPCTDPLWVNMPMNHPSTVDKTNYCARCQETGGGVAVNGTYLVDLNPSTPHYTYNPQSGTNYCPCCDGGHSSGDMDCDNPEWVAQNPGAARKCFICQQAPAPCEQISNIPGMTVAIAQGMGLNLYNDQATCNSQTECGPGTPTGGRCDQMTQGVYDPSGNNPAHNEDWGLGCWFCHPEPNHPDFPGCTMIQSGMDQVNAYSAFTAGTSGVYITDAACQADPLTKCGEDPVEMIKCMCCDGNDPISMATEVPASQGCPGSYPGYTNCLLHPVSGGTIPKNYCKKIVEPGDIPVDDVEVPMPMVKPGIERDRSDRPDRRLREVANYINKILKK